MKKKTLTIAIALVLVVALAVGATYAYLKAETGEVKNTFVAGSAVADGDLELFEHVAKKNDDGTYTLDSTTTTTGNKYTVMPREPAEGPDCQREGSKRRILPVC